MQKLNINQTVWRILSSDLAIQKDIARRIINVRALAKLILKQYQLPASLDSVISSIRRYQGEAGFEEGGKELLHVFRDSVVSTRNNMACVTLGLRLQELLTKVCLNNDQFVPFKVTSGSEAVKIIVEQPHLELVRGWFDKKDVQSVEKDLSELSVVVSEKAIRTKGVMARIANELSLANINMHELLVCPPEFLIYVKERDIVKAHDAILKLCEGRE